MGFIVMTAALSTACSGSTRASIAVDGGAAGASALGGSSAGGSTSASQAGASGAQATTLNQSGNPVWDKLSPYVDWRSTALDSATRLAEDETFADNMITWQLPEGGFYKNAKTVYAAAWNGSAPRSGWHGANGIDLGTIDNAATTTELLFLADVYKRSGEARYRDAARATLEFLLTMQYPSGGFPQVYPPRVGTTYSNYVTFNDDAMVRVLMLLHVAVELISPLDGDVFTDEQRERAAQAIAQGIDFIVNSQIEQDGIKTVWCAQHDPITYAPTGARSYELPSKSGKESEAIVGFLMTQPQTPTVEAAVKAALAWYASDTAKVVNTAFVKRPSSNTDDSYDPIQSQAGSTLWYRFYDLDTDRGFFSGRLPTDNPPGVGKQYDLMLVEPERRYGYEWGGSYGTDLLAYGKRVGY